MRRLVLLGFALASLLTVSTAFVACGGDDDDDDTNTADSGVPGDSDAAVAADAGPDGGSPHGFGPR
jgi:hypothetical protein